MSIEDGGPAFPVDEVEGVHRSYLGMSLRDWFAGQALVGILAGREKATDGAMMAACAFIIADAMIAARKAVAND